MINMTQTKDKKYINDSRYDLGVKYVKQTLGDALDLEILEISSDLMMLKC